MNKTLTHPWSRLAVRDGKLVEGAANSGKPYLATPGIAFAAKKEAKQAPDGVRTAFGFQLNHAPDAPWRGMFEINLADIPPGILRAELKVEIDRDVLTIFCVPAHLERIYGFVKEAVAITNADYEKEKAAVLRRVEEEGHTDVVEATVEKNKTVDAKQQLKKLEL